MTQDPTNSKDNAVEEVVPITSFKSPLSGFVTIDEKHPDRALKYAKELKPIDDVTDVEYSKLKRKIDWMIMSLISLIYGVQYMDKSTCSFASIMGLLEALSMHGQIYSWTTRSFNLAYLVFVFPLSRLLQRFP